MCVCTSIHTCGKHVSNAIDLMPGGEEVSMSLVKPGLPLSSQTQAPIVDLCLPNDE